MNIARARILVTQAKRDMGKLLYLCGLMKKNPTNWSPDVRDTARRQLRSNFSVIQSMYKEYPQIKPEKVRQLSLF